MIDVGRIWPGWEIEELIGQGAYGKVYRIRKEELGERYYAALKVIEIPADEAEVKTLLDMGYDNLSIRDYYETTVQNISTEIRTMSELKSAPNIVHVEEHRLMQREEGLGWTILIRMELLTSLSEWIRRNGAPDVKETVRIGKDICAALVCCEQKRIVHRDLKPDNVFRTEFGTYKLGDFGIARQMEGTKSIYSQKGTAAYMAPEVSRGEKYDSTVDIYSLGIMLYHFLNRQKPPFIAADSFRINPKMMEDAQWKRISGQMLPPPADAPSALANVILRACHPDPARRYRTAGAFLEALTAYEEGKIPEPAEGPYAGASSPAAASAEAQESAFREDQLRGTEENRVNARPEAVSGNAPGRRKMPLVPVAVTASILAVCVCAATFLMRGPSEEHPDGQSVAMTGSGEPAGASATEKTTGPAPETRTPTETSTAPPAESAAEPLPAIPATVDAETVPEAVPGGYTVRVSGGRVERYVPSASPSYWDSGTSMTCEAGTLMRVIADPPPGDGYKFSEWRVVQGEGSFLTKPDMMKSQFYMPEEDISLEARYEAWELIEWIPVIESLGEFFRYDGKMLTDLSMKDFSRVAEDAGAADWSAEELPEDGSFRVKVMRGSFGEYMTAYRSGRNKSFNKTYVSVKWSGDPGDETAEALLPDILTFSFGAGYEEVCEGLGASREMAGRLKELNGEYASFQDGLHDHAWRAIASVDEKTGLVEYVSFDDPLLNNYMFMFDRDEKLRTIEYSARFEE